jgi:hypothetical protein
MNMLLDDWIDEIKKEESERAREEKEQKKEYSQQKQTSTPKLPNFKFPGSPSGFKF